MEKKNKTFRDVKEGDFLTSIDLGEKSFNNGIEVVMVTDNEDGTIDIHYFDGVDDERGVKTLEGVEPDDTYTADWQGAQVFCDFYAFTKFVNEMTIECLEQIQCMSDCLENMKDNIEADEDKKHDFVVLSSYMRSNMNAELDGDFLFNQPYVRSDYEKSLEKENGGN